MFVRIVLDNYKIRTKARHRDGKKGKYSPTKKKEETLAWDFRQQAVGVVIKEEVYVNWKLWGKYTGDVDNYEKLIFDALQKSGIILNDRQIKGGTRRLYSSCKFWGLEVEIEPGNSVCGFCGDCQ